MVELVDISNTLCSLAGIDLMETSDGRDLSHLLAGAAVDPERIGVTEFAWSKSLRKGDFRLVHYPRAMFPDQYPDGFGELYDLAADPWGAAQPIFRGPLSGSRAGVAERTPGVADHHNTSGHGSAASIAPDSIGRNSIRSGSCVTKRLPTATARSVRGCCTVQRTRITSSRRCAASTPAGQARYIPPTCKKAYCVLQ